MIGLAGLRHATPWIDEAEKKDFARGKVIKLSVFCINSWKNTGFFRVNIVVLR